MGVKALPLGVKALPWAMLADPPVPGWPLLVGENLLGERSSVSMRASVHVSTTPQSAASCPTLAHCSRSVAMGAEERLSLADVRAS